MWGLAGLYGFAGFAPVVQPARDVRVCPVMVIDPQAEMNVRLMNPRSAQERWASRGFVPDDFEGRDPAAYWSPNNEARYRAPSRMMYNDRYHYNVDRGFDAPFRACDPPFFLGHLLMPPVR